MKDDIVDRLVSSSGHAVSMPTQDKLSKYLKLLASTGGKSEEQLFTLSAEEALAILAQPRQRRGRGAPKPPLRELGTDADSGKSIVVKEGRFGPYVTYGETNASLRRTDDVESITLERATELLAERRAKGPATKRRRRG